MLPSRESPSGEQRMLDAEQLATVLEAFIRQRFRVRADDDGFTRKTNLWEEGYVDSAGVVEVLAFLEEQVGARLPDDLLFEPEFATIDGMARMSLEGT
ncbi:MAG: hypothetical protein H6721_05125 [Sandaracinus sp.]|nr:hypothetical protein [Myxococcales bacterium]MCB9599238.1 hypothetical protein [Sandaracinus sp.]MCB9614814.1 hypothetical protein [Sandaracinus sp.]MCB9631511.1 hypothetical protein [Sandaracinus sp.]